MIFKNSRGQGPLLVATFLSVGCLTTVTEQPYNPFLVPADTVRSVVNTVIITPVVPPEGIFVSAMAASRIDLAIEARLRQDGYSVVPAAEYSRIWDGVLRQMGGFFDPITGQRDEEKFGAARKELLRELKGRFDTQVLLYTELQVVDASVDNGVASWDGVTHDIRGSDGLIRSEFYDTFERGEFGGSTDGVISAVTLMVAIDGPAGKELYRNFGGVEVLARRRGLVVETEGDFELRADVEHVELAVNHALGPLMTRRTMPRARPPVNSSVRRPNPAIWHVRVVDRRTLPYNPPLERDFLTPSKEDP